MNDGTNYGLMNSGQLDVKAAPELINHNGVATTGRHYATRNAKGAVNCEFVSFHLFTLHLSIVW